MRIGAGRWIVGIIGAIGVCIGKSASAQTVVAPPVSPSRTIDAPLAVPDVPLEMAMPSSIDLLDPMGRESSGTSWVPDSTPIYARMFMRGRDMVMLHGAIYPRYTHVESLRGGERHDGPSWFMGMYSHPLGRQAELGLRAMFSLDPIIEGGFGYPLLYQSGESWHNRPLFDRQHPHNFEDELSATYSHDLHHGNSGFVYFGLPGEPALGPPAFMHRLSANDDPDAPISHHWQDSTHVSFGVLTAGLAHRNFKVEASAFNGKEPDENRWAFNAPNLSSASGRLSWNPNRDVAIQVSKGFLNKPEAFYPPPKLLGWDGGDSEDFSAVPLPLHLVGAIPRNEHRTTASILWNIRQHGDANIANSFVFGHKDESKFPKSNAYLFESDYQRRKDTIYTRYEVVGKLGGDLGIPFYTETLPNGSNVAIAAANTVFVVSAWTVGYVRDLTHHYGKGLDIGLGTQATLNTNPTSLDSLYGSHHSYAYEFFLRFRPARMEDPRPAPPPAPADNRITATLDPNPPRVGAGASLTVTVMDAAGHPATGANVQASLNMTTMDMGSRTVMLKEIAPGTYRGPVEFGMAGNWRVVVTVGSLGVTRELVVGR